MNKSYGLGIIFLILLCVSCFKDPGFSVTPAISYKSIAFLKSSTGEAIEVKLTFTDGDGDLGLADGDTTLDNSTGVDFTPKKVYDSLLGESIETNPNAFNYMVTFLLKNPDSTFKTCEDSPDICDSLTAKRLALYNGRFEDLNPDRVARPISGSLTYDLNSTSWVTVLKDKTIKLRIFIKDRKLHNSNIIETDTIRIE